LSYIIIFAWFFDDVFGWRLGHPRPADLVDALVLAPPTDMCVKLFALAVEPHETGALNFGDGLTDGCTRLSRPEDDSGEPTGLSPKVAVVVGQKDEGHEETEGRVRQAGRLLVFQDLRLEGADTTSHQPRSLVLHS
jgi:hypothetical protein